VFKKTAVYEVFKFDAILYFKDFYVLLEKFIFLHINFEILEE